MVAQLLLSSENDQIEHFTSISFKTHNHHYTDSIPSCNGNIGKSTKLWKFSAVCAKKYLKLAQAQPHGSNRHMNLHVLCGFNFWFKFSYGSAERWTFRYFQIFHLCFGWFTIGSDRKPIVKCRIHIWNFENNEMFIALRNHTKIWTRN